MKFGYEYKIAELQSKGIEQGRACFLAVTDSIIAHEMRGSGWAAVLRFALSALASNQRVTA